MAKEWEELAVVAVVEGERERKKKKREGSTQTDPNTWDSSTNNQPTRMEVLYSVENS